MSLLQIIVGAFIVVISVLWLRQKPRYKLNEPPLVPYKYPIIGHTFEYYKDVPGFLKKCHEEYGKIFSLYIWGTVQTYVGSEHYYEVFKNHNDFNFHDAHNDTFPIANFVNRPDEYFEPFLSYVKEFLQDLDNYVERMYYRLVKSLDEFVIDGKVIQPPIKTMRNIFASPVATGLFGEELRNDKDIINTIVNITSELSPWLSTPPALDFIFPGLHRMYLTLKFRYLNNPIKIHRKVILSKITPVIKQRMADQNRLGDAWKRPSDIMQGFMEKLNYDIEGVVDFMMVTIFASAHTTSLTFTQCLFDYINHPEYHKELLEEAERVYNNNKHLPYYEISTPNQMEKLDNFIKESFRIHRLPVTFPHKTVPSHYTFTNGYQVPKGRVIQIITQQIYFDPKAYGPDPEKFNPSHHVKSPATRPERNFIFFGTGKTLCPGRFFAIYLIKIAMHRILLKYNFRTATGKRAEPRRIGAFLFPSEEGIIFEKRKDSLIQ